jgi:hypothetical protein
MRKPVRRSTISEQSARSGFHRLARLLATLAMLLNQPLAAVHAATDEAHLCPTAPPTRSTRRGHRKTMQATPRGPSHPDDLHHQTCQVCPLVGSALLPPGSAKIGQCLTGITWPALPSFRRGRRRNGCGSAIRFVRLLRFI